MYVHACVYTCAYISVGCKCCIIVFLLVFLLALSLPDRQEAGFCFCDICTCLTNNSNERISRALFHAKHAQLC